MRKYKHSLKVSVALARGITDKKLVQNDSILDLAICQIADRILPDSEMCVFYDVFTCTNSWEEIHDYYKKHVADLKLSTIQKYANRAKDKIKIEAKTCKELDDNELASFSKTRIVAIKPSRGSKL